MTFFIDRLGMANNVLLIGQEHVPTDAKAREISLWIGIAEERAIAEMVVEEMQIILVQPFQSRIADGFSQLVKGANHFAIYFVFGERIDAETALRATNDKFRDRFHAVERGLKQKGVALGEASLDEMEALWQAAKRP